MAKDGGQQVSDGSKWLLESFVGALVQAIEAMTSERAEIRWQAGVTPAGDSPWMWWQQPITAGQSTIIWVGSPETSWNAIGRHALAAAGIPDATPEDCSGTWKEILGQALSSTTQAFTKRLKREINCQGGQEIPSAPSLSSSYGVEITLAGDKFQAQIGWNDAIAQLIEPAKTEPALPAPAAPKANAAAAAATGTPRSRPAVVENSRTLELLLEVELPVSVSFGRAQLPLKEVLKLNSGSIVELNRSISEPVDLIVNNCVIARGEVVVVEGNYGVRIKQIISREERLRTLY